MNKNHVRIFFLHQMKLIPHKLLAENHGMHTHQYFSFPVLII